MQYQKTIRHALLTLDILSFMQNHFDSMFPRMFRTAKPLLLRYISCEFEHRTPTVRELIDFKNELYIELQNENYLFKKDDAYLKEIDRCFVHLMEEKELNTYDKDTQDINLYETFINAEYLIRFERENNEHRISSIYDAIKSLALVHGDEQLVKFIDENP